MAIRVLIAEDDSVLRRTLVELLALEDGLDVVGHAGDGQAALELAGVVRPDVVLTDIRMPRRDGIGLAREIRSLLPECGIVVLTKFGDDDLVFGAIKAGALGYVLKDAPTSEIVEAVRRAATGEGTLSPALVRRMMDEFTRLSQGAARQRQVFAELSRRELEVLEMLAAGFKNSQIADRLVLSEKTVKSHVGSILRKLQVNDRAEAAELAKAGGLSVPEWLTRPGSGPR